MNALEFQNASIAILGTAVGWQSKIARKMGKPIRTIQRWVAADAVPDWATEQLREMMGGTDRSPFPRDEWLIGDALGDDGQMRAYVMHMQTPRFVARLVEVDDDGLPVEGEEPADILTGIVYQIDEGSVLCEIEWIDQPKAGEVTQLMEAAGDAIELMSDQ